MPGRQRRADAFEFDEMQRALVGPFADRGLSLHPVAWDAFPDTAFDAALIGTTWDYWDRADTFLDTLTAIEARTPLFNPTTVVRQNINKRYLEGMPTPPTRFVQTLDHSTAEAAFAAFRCERIVAKQQVGAGAHGQYLLERGQPVPATNSPMLLQPFLSSIQGQGEISVIVIDGAISHAVRKLPAQDDYRIQSLYGGRNQPHQATAAEATLALEVAPAGLLYARVDLIYVDDTPKLMELELIEPYLYPEQGPDLGPLLAEALLRRLA